jgi:general secretion pathway protein G
MVDTAPKQCAQCGEVLLPGRRFCLACQALVPGAARTPTGPLAKIIREIPSTHRPDQTLVFVPERREARLKHERKRKRLIIISAISLVIFIAAAISLSIINTRQKRQVQLHRRETMARQDLDLYAKALEFFRADFGRYPTAKEGLGALNHHPPSLINWRGPYIDKDYSIVDPWGNEYVYHVFNEEKNYELFTNGPEGETATHPFLRINVGTPPPSP